MKIDLGTENMNKNDYYLIITTIDDYEIDIENGFKFLGFPYRNKSSVNNFEVGNHIIMYLSKISSFAAELEVCGEAFYDDSQVWNDYLETYPCRIPCKVIRYAPLPKHDDYDFKPKHFPKIKEQMVFIKDIWDNLDLISNKGKWGSQLMGSFRKISEHDFMVISEALTKSIK